MTSLDNQMTSWLIYFRNSPKDSRRLEKLRDSGADDDGLLIGIAGNVQKEVLFRKPVASWRIRYVLPERDFQ